jgi:hypothetical protein
MRHVSVNLGQRTGGRDFVACKRAEGGAVPAARGTDGEFMFVSLLIMALS